MALASEIPVIDLFSGPGGLSEGFARFGERDWELELSARIDSPETPVLSHGKRLSRSQRFRIALSVEMDEWAHKTLELRAFFREFRGDPPTDYYQFIRGEISRERLFALHPSESRRAQAEALRAELGNFDERIVDRKIQGALGGARHWILLGGPPCQAYSLAGRSRRRGIVDYVAKQDGRHFLYREYLRIVAKHEPPVFVMENVKGMLSSKMDGKPIVDRILADLREPGKCSLPKASSSLRYRLFALEPGRGGDLWEVTDAREYVVCMERHGIPQARHRVILLGIRDDANFPAPDRLPWRQSVNAARVLKGLPVLRSGLSMDEDSGEAWAASIKSSLTQSWFRHGPVEANHELRRLMKSAITRQGSRERERGGRYVPCEPRIKYAPEWYLDSRIGGVCNHESRGHIVPDLHRYLFAACFGEVTGRSPRLGDFPVELLPDHRNVRAAIREGGNFDDRFRVQLADRPSTTITSHISKDGHYYIHYDPIQCRSLTVREAARLQTFPDNYFFCGNRTQQYHQVGNAVPPLLAVQIANVVAGLL
jgi:DNA (cytosine-5)-methyltransferase 1